MVVFLSSNPRQCLDRLEQYANAAPTVVLMESIKNSQQDFASVNQSGDKQHGQLDFLHFLSTDVQGAHFQKHVMSFVLLPRGESDSEHNIGRTPVASECFAAGALDVLCSPFEYAELSRLIGHVKEETRPPARLVGAPMAQNLVDSIRNASTPTIACHRPDQNIPDDRKLVIEKSVRQWGFSASSFNMDELTYGVLFMLEHVLKHPELKKYSLPRDQLITFLLATRRQYKHEREVHYHNWRHAVDVTQSIYIFLYDIRICPLLESDEPFPQEPNAVERMLTPLDGLVLIISAIGHDVGHPGVNNAFLIACNHPLAQTYNDKSVLENYHCAAYSQLLRRHWPSLSSIPNFRTLLISTILATDMQRHFEYMSNLHDLKNKVDSCDGHVDEWSDKDKASTRELLMALMMKAADISNVARPFDISATWARILMDEFARQGELESELQIPTCLFGGPPDKEDPLAAAQSQKGFMSLFGFPLFKGISEIMTSVSCSIRELENNQVTWDKRIEQEKKKKDERPTHEELHFSSVSGKEVDEAVGGHHKSEPMAVPIDQAQDPGMPVKRTPAPSVETSPSKHAAHELRHQLTNAIHADGEKRASAPFLASPTTGCSSRRSSKDVALDQYQQLQAFAHQSLNPSSRRGSADAGFHVHQSYPGSRRGSKDEALTVIHVTPGRQSSPSSPGKRSSPGKAAGPKRQSVPNNTKQNNTVRTSFPSSRSHATSSATATTMQHSPSVSTQPSSVTTEDDQPTPPGHRNSIPATEDPFITPGSWPTDVDGSHRKPTPRTEPTSHPSTPPINGASKFDSPRILTRLASGEADDRSTPRKEGGIRESRSRSRLRGLKFWRRKPGRDVSAVDPSASPGQKGGSTTSISPESPARQ